MGQAIEAIVGEGGGVLLGVGFAGAVTYFVVAVAEYSGFRQVRLGEAV